ncbi:hypothetical protein [Enterobacter sp. R4-368]|uniref:hypothetical protein n=1 Tax=Enterobacter sp. R4-368 TaxID=1166130 RepID=UPI00034F07A2|nr:hypothetical protein [Enterobacter sp. R4-368]AGN84924.1 hypothetical protein H650_06875 [Enterobacter sp. R4-368]
MTTINFELIRQRADSNGPALNKVRDKFFLELVAEHEYAYSKLSPSLYNISVQNNELKLDLSSIGLNIKTEERFIFVKNSVIKQLSFLHHDVLRQNIILICDIYLSTNGTFSLSPGGDPIGALGNGYSYDNFFNHFFNALKTKGLITSDY